MTLFKKNFMAPFLWMGFNCLKARATSRRHFTFYRHKVKSYIYFVNQFFAREKPYKMKPRM